MLILNSLLNLFFPDLCLSCKSRLVTTEKFICLSCLGRLPLTNYHHVRDNKLELLFAGRFPFNRAAALAFFIKNGTLQGVIHDLKYNNNPQLGIYLGELSGLEIADSAFTTDIDYLVPVPLHPKREKQRGYNQALKIAEGLSAKTGIPILPAVLNRVVNNQSQTRKSRFDRWNNTSDVFEISDSEILADKHILLIDDVVTTGSTIESCAKTILKHTHNTSISIFSVGVAVD